VGKKDEILHEKETKAKNGWGYGSRGRLSA
jgi:hypothetical protein